MMPAFFATLNPEKCEFCKREVICWTRHQRRQHKVRPWEERVCLRHDHSPKWQSTWQRKQNHSEISLVIWTSFTGDKHSKNLSITQGWVYLNTRPRHHLISQCIIIWPWRWTPTRARQQREKPVAYASRSMASTEQRYAQIEKEALATTWACEKFNDYILGKDILIETDHKPLVPLFDSRTLDELLPRIQIFRMRRMKYSFKMLHVPGKELVTTDTLSRAPLDKQL